MRFLAAFHDPAVLTSAAAQRIGGELPHLRLVSLLPAASIAPALEQIAPHVRDRVIASPAPELLASGAINVVVTGDRAATQRAFPHLNPADVTTWSELPGAYERWRSGEYLPFHAHVATFTPDGLVPVDDAVGEVVIEIIGSCAADRLHHAVSTAAPHLPGRVRSFWTAQNHPGQTSWVERPEWAGRPSLRVVVPPLRYMHPRTLDDFLLATDHDRLFAQTRQHMFAYLDSAAGADLTVPLFVVGFIEPYMNPAGAFFPLRRLSNFKYFVRCLNDALVDWCDQRVAAHFVDGNEIASAIGKAGVEEGTLQYFAHRTPMEPVYDDDRDDAEAIAPARRCYADRSEAYMVALVRDIVHRHITLTGAARVKAVIVDLDNTLWRGLASDGVIGSWNSRPSGLVEALRVLKQRGVLLAVASKNDEAYIRAHWAQIVGEWAEEPLGLTLGLDDFDIVKIDFRPKSVTVGEILAELNILPDSVVFVDDNPLEREDVQVAFPQIRVLGSELNYVRRELLHSPFTQSEIQTAEDGARSATVKQQALLQRHIESGTAAGFLHALQLHCSMFEVTDVNSPAGQRAVQLINKTNQWSLNGGRVEPAGAAAALAAQGRLFAAEVRDAVRTYGIVAAALIDADSARVEYMVVSCRVIGMGIDEAVAHDLLQRFGPLVLSYDDSGRNRAATAFLDRYAAGGIAGRDTRLTAVPAPDHVTLAPPALSAA